MKISDKFYDMQGVIFDSAPDGIIVVNHLGIIEIANPKAYELFGYKPGEMEGEKIESLVPIKYQNTHQTFSEDFILKKQIRTKPIELPAMRKDKSVFISEIGLSHYYFNKQTFVLCIVKDIDERKKIEKDLKNSESKYRALFDNSTEGIFQSTVEGKFITANLSLAKMLKYSDVKDLLISVTDISSQLYSNPLLRKEIIDTIISGKDVRGLETQFKRKDGSLIWVCLNIHAVRDETGNILYLEGTNIEVEEMMKTRLELERNEKLLSLIMENVGEIIYYIKLSKDNNFYFGKVEFLNSVVRKVLGYNEKDFYNDPKLWYTIVHPDDVNELKRTSQEIYNSKLPGVRKYRMKIKDKDNYAVFEDRVVPQLNDKGELLGIFGVAREVKYTLHL